MLDPGRIINCRPPGREATEGEKHRRTHIQADEARGRAWLPWHSNKQDRGLKPHKVRPDGSIVEIGDLATPARERRKPKAISSHQWAGAKRV